MKAYQVSFETTSFARLVARSRVPPLALAVSANRSAEAARGLWGGIFGSWMLEPARTASNESVNCPARLRTTNRKPAT